MFEMTEIVDKIHCADCLDFMPQIPDQSFNLILADLPYGTTQNQWDSIIPLEPMWTQYRRLIKPNGVVILTAQGKFSAMLIMSAAVKYQYSAVWCKHNHTNQLNAKKQFLRRHEDILFFYNSQPTYNPQGLIPFRKLTKQGQKATTCYNKHDRSAYLQEWTNWPDSLVMVDGKTCGIHPTEKPVALFGYLIKTFTNQNDFVLDNASGSGTTAVCCRELGRHFVCIEKDSDMYVKSVERLKKTPCAMNVGQDPLTKWVTDSDYSDNIFS